MRLCSRPILKCRLRIAQSTWSMKHMRAHGICLPANFKAHAAVARAHARHTPRRSHTTARITHHGIHDPHCHTLISLVIIHSRLQSFELQAPSTIEVSGPCHARRTRPMRPAQSRMIQSALGHFAKLRLSETETCYRIMLETAAARWRAARVAICCPARPCFANAHHRARLVCIFRVPPTPLGYLVLIMVGWSVSCIGIISD